MALWPNHAARRKASHTSRTGRVASSVLVRVARFSVEIKASAQKELDALDRALFARIDRKIMALADNPTGGVHDDVRIKDCPDHWPERC